MGRISGYILNLYFRFPGIRMFFLMMIVFIIFSIVSVMLMVSDQVKTDPVGWEKMKIISPAGVSAKNIHADRRGSLVAAVFEGTTKSSRGIYITLSFDGGNSFSSPQRLTEFPSEISGNPRVAISPTGEIYAAWYILMGDESESRIYYTKSSDMGGVWSTPEIITFGMQMEILPEPVYDNRGNLHIFFTSYSGGSFNLFHAATDEKGVFGKPGQVIKVKGNLKGAFFPAVKIVKNYIAVVCQGKDESYSDHLYFAVSDDYGSSWSSVDRITTGKSNSQSPAIEVYDDTIYLVYMNNSEKNWSINLLRGYRFGSRWDESPIKISTTNANCFSPDISGAPENELFITWHDLREKGSRVFYRKLAVKNGELSEESKLSVKQTAARNPVCIDAARRLVVMWEDGGRIAVNYSDNRVSPPEVFSRSHPENRWSRENSAVVNWKKPFDESGIAGYAMITDKSPNTNPTIQNQRGDASSALLTGLDDGITYFHIRAIDGAGNMSRTVHYKLQVSSNPLSIPVIVSPTHPENVKSKNTDAVFHWAINDSRRLKGFLYSVSKDTSLKPEKFIKDFEIKFNELENGVYYFNLAAVSTTDQVSRVATYCFIVGEGAIDKDYLKNIAGREYDYRESAKRAPSPPTLEIALPFGKAGIFNAGSFTALLKPVNISSENVSGYSVVIDSVKKVPPDRINLMSGILNVDGLVKGDYTLGVRCRYFKEVGGKKKYYWTEPVYSSFRIVPEAPGFPLEKIYARLMQRYGSSPLVFSVVILLLSVSVSYRGYGNRIGFYMKLLHYKLRF